MGWTGEIPVLVSQQKNYSYAVVHHSYKWHLCIHLFLVFSPVDRDCSRSALLSLVIFHQIFLISARLATVVCFSISQTVISFVFPYIISRWGLYEVPVYQGSIIIKLPTD
uniref:Uncharacterized protein n=1 Tax=Cacopsylla melanoneura TaxID=428564 RepID=A0A8D8QR51_9HEMI